MGAGLKDMISSYSSSFNCSRLMSSLCTVAKGNVSDELRRVTTLLTVEFKELGVERGRNGLIVRVVLQMG